MSKWDDYYKKFKKEKEEEEQKQADREKSLSAMSDSDYYWDGYQTWKQTGKMPESRKAEKEPEPEEEKQKSLTDRLAARGIQVEMPEPKKTAKAEDTRPTLAEAAERGSTGSSLFTDRLRNTTTAREEETNALAKLLEEERKNQTVRNDEWLSSLRTPEEIRAELDEAKAEEANERKKRELLGAAGNSFMWDTEAEAEAYRKSAQEIPEDNTASERVKALEDELAERTWADYERLRNNADFEKKSQYRSTEKERTEQKAGEPVYYDPLYEYINGNDAAVFYLQQAKNAGAVQNPAYKTAVTQNAAEYRQYQNLTDDERALYNYIHETDGKDKANEYLAYLMSDLNARRMENEKAKATAFAGENGLNAALSTAGTILASPLRGAAYLGQALDYAVTGSIDPNAPINRVAALPAAERETVTRMVERNWGKAGTFFYGVGVSMAEFLLNNALTGGGASGVSKALSLTIMGSGAAANATIEAKERGLSDEQSYALGTIAGLAEMITELVSVENLFNGKWETEPLRYLIKNTIAEGSEEAGSDLINWFADVLLARDKSEWQQAINKYMTVDHMNEHDAFIAALKDKGLEILLDAGSGALSGFLMAAGPSAKGLAQKSADRSADAEALRRAAQEQRSAAQSKATAPDITKGIQNAQQQAQTEQQIVLPTAEQNTAAEPEGMVLPTGAENAEAEMAAEYKGGDTLRFGTEPETRTLTPTVEEAEINDAVAKAEAEGNITRATGIRYGVKEKTIRQMERLSEVTGHRVQFFDGKLANGQTANGFTNKDTGDIYINANAKQPVLFTFAHEFTHNLEGTDAYQALMDHFKSRAMDQGFDWQRERNNKKPVYERGLGQQVDNVYIDQEILADRIAESLGDEKTIREICRENPSVAKRIRDALDKFIIHTSNMSGVISGYEQEKMQNAFKLYERWLQREALREAAEQEAREDAQTNETVQAAVYPTGTETMQTAEAEEGTEGTESPAEYLARMGELYDAGEISEEEYEAAQDLAAEMESTGRGIESSTVERDEGPRGKIAEALKRAGRKYSLSPDSEQRDEDYRAAVDAGDMETAQRMVDEAARDAGYTIRAYHGTPNGTFTVFRDWSYFTEDQSYAGVYQNQGASSNGYKQTALNPKTYAVFIAPKNAFDTRNVRDRQIFENEFFQKWGNGAPLSDRGLPDWTDGDDLIEFFEEQGYDYDAVYLDEGGTGGYGEDVKDRGISIAVKDSAQIKSADPVTYDDAGNVIPLSERFNPEDPDIRYSLAEDNRIGEKPAEDTESWYFKNWFGDWQNDPENASKVVNPDGTPKVMYHGTNADQDFHIFNTYGANYGLYGGGSYFTDNPEVAQGYTKKGRGNNPRVYQVYLNIRNPIVMEQEADVDRWLDAIPELENYITKQGDSEITAVTNRDFYRAMEEYFADEGMYKWEAEEAAMDTLKNMGYDGINHVGGMNKDIQHDVWIAFDPEQIKSATENIGTYDPEEADIRYSLEENQNELAGLSQKAKAAALRIERQLTNDVLQGIQENLNPNSAEYRRFRADVARPVIEAMLRGEQADVDAVLESTGIDIVGQAAARGAVNDALRRASGEIGRIRTAVQQTNDRQAARDARNAEIDARIPDNSAGLIELANRVKDAKKRLNTLKARTIMQEEDMDLAHRIATGQITPEEAVAQNALGMDDIINMAEAERAFREQDEVWSRYTRRLSERRIETADRLLEDAHLWKDKAAGFLYDRETAIRNFRDIMGKDAPAMIDEYLRNIGKAESASTKFKNEYIKRVTDLKLDRKVRRGNAVSEAAAVQWLGEAEDDIRVLEWARSQNAVRDGKTLAEWRAEVEAFKAANPNLDYGKVSRGIEEFQKIYNELITRMNEELVENGYMPVNVRRGYFPHFNGGDDGILAKFAGMLGINVNAVGLPTSINGLTYSFKPGKTWFGHAMERTGFATDYDAVQGFAGYIGGVSDVIHQTANIRNLRTLASRIRYRFGDEGLKKQVDEINAREDIDETQKQVLLDDLYKNGKYKLANFVAWLDEYTNLLANKTPLMDRNLEQKIGRKWYNQLKSLEGRVAANMISGNLGSALTNFIPLTQAAAQLDQRLGDIYMLRGMYDAVAGMARHDGFVRRSDFLTNRRGTDPLIRNTVDKIASAFSKPMEIIDNITSETIVRAAYAKNIRQGMDPDSAMQAADEFAADVMADRSKGAMPVIFSSRNPITKLFTQFQLEVNNQFSEIFKDIPKGVHIPDKEKKNMVAMAAWTFLRYFIGAYLFNDLYEKLVGRRAALDPVDLLNDAVGDFTGKKLNNIWDVLVKRDGLIEETSRENPSVAMKNLRENALEELPFVGGLFGGGRVPISSAFPDWEQLENALGNENWSLDKRLQVGARELGGSVGTYILPPALGGVGKKVVQTAENALAGGRYVKDKEGNDLLQYPYFTDTPLETAGTLLTSAAFGPTATKGGRDWVEGGFGNQSVKNTALYRTLTEELGESQRESWDFLQSLRQQDTYGKRMAIAESGLSEEGKAYAMETLLNSGNSTEGTKFRAAYDNGVSADAWAYFYNVIPDYDADGNKSYTQKEIAEALDNVQIPLSSGEGAAQGLFGGSTETRHLTNSEKAALWSAYYPTWATKNNPYSPQIGERVVSRYNALKGGES